MKIIIGCIYLFENSTNRVVYGQYNATWLKAKGKYRDATQEEIDAFVLDKDKKELLATRKNYLQETAIKWFDDIENMPAQIATNRATCKSDIISINSCTDIAELTALDLNVYLPF